MIVTLIFMDEAGDTGFNLGAGASRYFIVTIVIFDTPLEAERVSAAVDALREDLRMSSQREFRFSVGSSSQVKTKFLQNVVDYTFRYRAVIVNKASFQRAYPQNTRENLLEFIFANLFRADAHIREATLVVDRITSGEFEKQFNVFVRRQLKKRGTQPIRKFKHADSQRNNLLQLADMICGAVYRKFSRNDDTFYRIVRVKEDELIGWE